MTGAKRNGNPAQEGGITKTLLQKIRGRQRDKSIEEILRFLVGCSTEYLDQCLRGSMVPSDKLLRLFARAAGRAPDSLIKLRNAGYAQAVENYINPIVGAMAKKWLPAKLEREHGKSIEEILRRALEARRSQKGVLYLVAADIGISDGTLYQWCREFGIDVDEYRRPRAEGDVVEEPELPL